MDHELCNITRRRMTDVVDPGEREEIIVFRLNGSERVIQFVLLVQQHGGKHQCACYNHTSKHPKGH